MSWLELIALITVGIVGPTLGFVGGVLFEGGRWCANALLNPREPYYCRGEFYYAVPEAEYVVMKVACMERQLQKQICDGRQV